MILRGLGKGFCLGRSRSGVAAALLETASLPFLCGPRAGVAALALNAVAVAAGRSYFHRRIGGVTGDCLGAVGQISEVVMLLVFICPLFI